MNVYGPLRVALFIYEVFRFSLMIGVVTLFWPLQDLAGGIALGRSIFPYVVYVVPNALFPLMTCFVCIRLSLYKSYISLYIAGKTIVVTSIIGWCVFSLKSIITSTSIERIDTIIAVGLTLLLTAADALSIFGGLMLQTKVHQLEIQALERGGI